MRDYIEVGPVPYDEDCEQLGSNYDATRAKLECNTFLKQIRRELGEEPSGARLRVRSNSHDFGTYYEVACYYDTESQEAIDYALKCEQTSENWDEESRLELGLK